MKQIGVQRLSSSVSSTSRPARMHNGESFDDFVAATSPRLRRAFVARYGVELGNEALADALSWAWENRERLSEMDNPAGYLYRVGQTSVRRNVRRRRRALLPPEEPGDTVPESDLGLHIALDRLTDDQRVAVLLVHAHGYSYADAAALLDIPVSTLRNHIHRGMKQLRRHLEH